MRDGWENSERVTGQGSENQHAWEGKREKTHAEDAEDAEEDMEIKRWEGRGERDTWDFPEKRRARQESKTRMTGRREGIKQGISIFTQSCIPE